MSIGVAFVVLLMVPAGAVAVLVRRDRRRSAGPDTPRPEAAAAGPRAARSGARAVRHFAPFGGSAAPRGRAVRH
ncbi:hypothetical protein ACFY0A_10720 [Streptomyces sp. NPDC001698]|uniref:hypothetical protein n=1 Tax=unclassified Streptomyces TaxID=2593676 RepID=UPI0036BE1784